jgi:D-beta-D-heptose 7-phosphate kinase / D-beta-D-heptose 1-phosphate adenosyltransferase
MLTDNPRKQMPSVREFEGRTSALVFGDVMLDRRITGRVDRISPEAPVPILNVEHEDCCLGGAGHVAASLAGLGCNVTLAGVVGDDADGRALSELLERNRFLHEELVADRRTATICKTRLVAGKYQQLARLDRDGQRDVLMQCGEKVGQRISSLISQHQVVVIGDYDKGTISGHTAHSLIANCRRLHVPCLVDGKKSDFRSYTNATLLVPNHFEVERALGRKMHGNEEFATVAEELRQQLSLDYMIITRGADGLTLASERGSVHMPAEARDVADVTGAGDTVVAVLAACVGNAWPIEPACRLAVLAAGIAVSKPGTYVVGADELDAVHRGLSPKLVSWNGAKRAVQTAQNTGKRVVFTNGCFDILHAGHLSCLERSRQLGDLLVVGLNSDASVRLNKGASRPVISAEHRAALVAGLACVDLIVIFDEERPEELIRHLAPDILVKGNDYSLQQIAGADFVTRRGGRVVTLPLVPGLSSSRILSHNRIDT